MPRHDVAEKLSSTNPILLTGFLGQLSDQYNCRHDRPMDSPVNKSLLMAWLTLRADGASDPDGLSVLESEILRHRNDVHVSVLENGAINICRLRLWAITHGAHELCLGEELLSDTIEHALSLKANGALKANGN